MCAWVDTYSKCIVHVCMCKDVFVCVFVCEKVKL